MLQISFDNLSKKQKILEEDTLYSLYQANQKYEELKKFIIDSKDKFIKQTKNMKSLRNL